MELKASNITLGYQQKNAFHSVLTNVSVELQPGDFVALIGPNGSGKSTLLKALAGLISVHSGQVSINGQAINQISQADKSKLMALVLTEKVINPYLTVEELVALGRYPYTGWSGSLNKDDQRKIEEAIHLVGLTPLQFKPLDQLSDGERQRAMIARALAQDTPFIILDEPTAHLDIQNRVDLLLLLRHLSRTTGKSIVVSTHELTLALDLADQIWLIPQNGKFVQGIPEELMINGEITKAFDSEHVKFDAVKGLFNICHDIKGEVAILGDGPTAELTAKAFNRRGFIIQSTSQTAVVINKGGWEFNGQQFTGLKELLVAVENKITK